MTEQLTDKQRRENLEAWWELFESCEGELPEGTLDKIAPYIHRRQEAPGNLLGLLDNFKDFREKYTAGWMTYCNGDNGAAWETGFLAAHDRNCEDTLPGAI